MLLRPVLFLGDPVRVERVRLHDVGARGEVLAVDLADHVGAGEHEQVVVALEVAGVIGEHLPAVVLFFEVVALDHRPHRPVQVQDAIFDRALEG